MVFNQHPLSGDGEPLAAIFVLELSVLFFQVVYLYHRFTLSCLSQRIHRDTGQIANMYEQTTQVGSRGGPGAMGGLTIRGKGISSLF